MGHPTDDGRRAPSVRTGPAFRNVPLELRNREVSVRAVGPLWQAVKAKHLDPERLAEGTGYSVDHWMNHRERVSWDGFTRFLTNFGPFLDDEELVALGDRAMRAPALRLPLLPGRLLFTIPELYLWTWGPRGPGSQLFVNHEGFIEEIEPGMIRFETHMKPGYRPSRENYLLLRGSLQGLSQAAGAGKADVVEIPLEDGARYLVTVPQTGGPLRFLRRTVNWMFAARSTARSS
jgi:hypothetical protein